MPRSYPKLSREQWREIAVDVVSVSRSIHSILHNHVGKFPKNSDQSKAMWKLQKSSDVLRSRLDDELGRQFKRNEMSFEEFVSYFYPKNHEDFIRAIHGRTDGGDGGERAGDEKAS